MSEKQGLTCNEVALCLSSVQICQTWWREHDNGSGYAKEQMAALKALNKKLSAILDAAFPEDEFGKVDYDTADEILLAPQDGDVVGKLVEALKEMQIDYCDEMCRDRSVEHMHECEKASAVLALFQSNKGDGSNE